MVRVVQVPAEPWEKHIHHGFSGEEATPSNLEEDFAKQPASHLSSCQNDGPVLDPYCNTAPNIYWVLVEIPLKKDPVK